MIRSGHPQAESATPEEDKEAAPQTLVIYLLKMDYIMPYILNKQNKNKIIQRKKFYCFHGWNKKT